MANNLNIGVNFTGNLGNLPGQAAAAAASLNGVGGAANSAAAGLGNAGAAAQSAGRGLNNLAPLTRPSLQGLTLMGQAGSNAAAGLGQTASAATAAGRALNATRNNAGGANAALTDLGRIVQDAPFGIVGITNNITQLSDSFGRLRQQTGSGRAALSALLGSLTGPGGIGIAISLVTTALTFASVGFGAWTRGLTGSKAATDEAKKSAEEYQNALRGIVSSIAEEASRVGTLIKALQSDTLTRQERNAAIKELQKINPTYFGQLKDEKGLIDALTASYNNYLSSLKEQFAAKAIDKQLAALFDQRLTIETRIDTKTTSDARKDLSVLKSNYEAEIAKLGGIQILDNVDLTQPLTDAQKRVQQLQQAIRNLEQPRTIDFANAADQKRLASINKEIDGLLIRRLRFGSKGLDLKINDGKDKPDEELKRLKDELDGLQKQLASYNKLREAGLLPLNLENDALETQLKIFDLLSRIDTREVAIKAKPSLEIDPRLAELEIQLAYSEFAERSGRGIDVPLLIRPRLIIDVAGSIIPDGIAEDYAKAITNKINTSTQKAFKAELNFGSLLTDALSEGIAAIGEGGNVFGAIFQSIGAGLKSLGTALIAYGVAAEAFKKTFRNPFAAIAAGAGLILAGSLLQKAIPQFADGVRGFAGGLAVVGERGPELVNLPPGSDVIPNHLLGAGQEPIPVYGVIRGEDIYLSNNRAARRRGRM